MSVDIKDSNPAFQLIGIGIQSGAGAPTYAATKGSLYIRTDGSSASTRLYINTDGNVTWTSVTTAA